MLMKVVSETEIWKLPDAHLDRMLGTFYEFLKGKGITPESEKKRMYVSVIATMMA